MNPAKLRQRFRSDDTSFTELVVSPSPRWPDVVKTCGLDFVFIDTGHIALDRPNYRKFNKRDPEDEGEYMFSSTEERAELGTELTKVNILKSLRKKTLKGSPIIYVGMSDEIGWNALGCFGFKLVQTPRINQLAADRMRFSLKWLTSP